MDFETSILIQKLAAQESELARQAAELEAARHKIKVYESFLHLLQMHAEVTMDRDRVRRLIERACAWSYAHRSGNGELSEEEQQERIDAAFANLLRIDP